MPAELSAQDLLEQLLRAPDARNLSADFLREAERFFRARGDAARARWMRLEREGYGARTEATNLGDVLGAGSPDELVGVVLATRRRHGRVVVGGVERRWPHFFVESVDDLRRWEERVRGGGPPTVSLEFDVVPGDAGPHALSFSRGIFGELLDGIAVEIGATLQQAGGSP